MLTPGGSSSGSGIAVSANLVAVSIGTETSGSILSPGSSNGVVGIKPTVGLVKYGQAIFLAADQLDTSPGSADTQRYLADRALDLALTRGGLDALLNGPDGIQGTDDDFDAILFPQNRGAAAPAKAGYPSIVVPGGFMPPSGPVINPAPFGVTFTGRAFSERFCSPAIDHHEPGT